MRWVGAASCVVGLLCLSLSATASADEAPKSIPTKEAREEARKRFDRGVELFNEQEYERSLIEFERAYALAPNYTVLYNMAQVSVQLRRYAKAVVLFERFLAEGGGNIPESRVEEAERELAAARDRTAKLLVRVNKPGAEITIDDQLLATSPMTASALIDSGQHRITVTKPQHQASVRIVVVAGGDDTALDVALEPTVIERPVSHEKPSRAPMWIAWGATGVLAGATTLFGVAALNAASELDDLKQTLGTSQSERDAASSKAETLATVSSVLGGAAILSAGIAVYFTLSSRSSASVGASGSMLRLQGTF